MKFIYYYENDDEYEFEADFYEIDEAMIAIYGKDSEEYREYEETGEDEPYRDALYDYFEADAQEEYDDACDFKRDTYGYYGIRERDFH